MFPSIFVTHQIAFVINNLQHVLFFFLADFVIGHLEDHQDGLLSRFNGPANADGHAQSQDRELICLFSSAQKPRRFLEW